MSFDQKLYSLRRKKGLTQETLAETLGLSRQAIARWENGTSIPDVNNLIALSDFFHVSIDHLLRSLKPCSAPCTESQPHTDAFTDFLILAKLSCYAGGQKPIEASCRPASSDFHFAQGDYAYIDTYLGSSYFMGEESVYLSGLPIWGMNYVGRVLEVGFSGDFLKAALQNLPPDAPYRGPSLYREGDFTYACSHQGAPSFFHGEESIFLRNNKVYDCLFHGGELH